MAKKKVDVNDGTVTEEVKIDYADRIKKEITKKYGDSIFMTGKDAISKPRQILSISPSLDLGLKGPYELYGGIPEGTISTISGKPKTGKSTSILSMCAQFQKPEYGSRHIYYFDVEHRIKPMNLMSTFGLDYTDKFSIIRSEEGKILTAEENLEIAESICNSCPGAVIVIDSASALCAEKERIGDITAAARNDGPKLLATFLRRVKDVVPVNRITMFIIQHMIANTAGKGGPTMMEDGGNKIQFALDTKLRLAWSTDWKEGAADDSPKIGLIAHWNVLTSALGAMPGQMIDSYIRFGHGIDHLYEWMTIGKNVGLITTSGSWYAFGEEKRQGDTKLYNFFKENEDAQTELITKIKEMLYPV